MKANLITFTILFISLFPAISKGTHSSQSLPTADTDCTPAITIDVVPEMGSFDNLEGTVSCADPATHHVAVYIFTANGWWSKPTFANPLTLIQPDGSWNANYTTGGTDHLATMLIAFLVPDSYTPPLMGGGSTLPAELFANTLANDRVLRFSDFRWTVKQFDTPVGPGPNLFSGLPEDVWIDGNGRLHLTISQHNGQWFSTEVFTRETLGYGTYVFYTTGQLDQLDENIILGLFTWDNNAPANYYREIDIEIAKWGNP
ncbi:MAG: hypothetical protein KC421_09055, partial [Anaerolineales bacterium]|nr:hypothetical protein [Anaerolineales bacterium]